MDREIPIGGADARIADCGHWGACLVWLCADSRCSLKKRKSILLRLQMCLAALLVAVAADAATGVRRDAVPYAVQAVYSFDRNS